MSDKNDVKWLPQAHFSGPGESLTEDDFPDDDEELAETPSDVVMMLGFDPMADPEFNDGGAPPS